MKILENSSRNMIHRERKGFDSPQQRVEGEVRDHGGKEDSPSEPLIPE